MLDAQVFPARDREELVALRNEYLQHDNRAARAVYLDRYEELFGDGYKATATELRALKRASIKHVVLRAAVYPDIFPRAGAGNVNLAADVLAGSRFGLILMPELAHDGEHKTSREYFPAFKLEFSRLYLDRYTEWALQPFPYTAQTGPGDDVSVGKEGDVDWMPSPHQRYARRFLESYTYRVSGGQAQKYDLSPQTVWRQVGQRLGDPKEKLLPVTPEERAYTERILTDTGMRYVVEPNITPAMNDERHYEWDLMYGKTRRRR